MIVFSEDPFWNNYSIKQEEFDASILKGIYLHFVRIENIKQSLPQPPQGYYWQKETGGIQLEKSLHVACGITNLDIIRWLNNNARNYIVP